MATTRVKPRGPFYACKHARTHACVFVDTEFGPEFRQYGGHYLVSIRWRSKPVVRLDVEATRESLNRIFKTYLPLASPLLDPWGRIFIYGWISVFLQNHQKQGGISIWILSFNQIAPRIKKGEQANNKSYRLTPAVERKEKESNNRAYRMI
jgi:hypothetical protein